mmetsp:Transcript_2393/g.6172  ORF Transcript_2393/g.6172 Transcript_2393/m.6172 type:complete len:88 (+) Transcript_2393:1-264(+)
MAGTGGGGGGSSEGVAGLPALWVDARAPGPGGDSWQAAVTLGRGGVAPVARLMSEAESAAAACPPALSEAKVRGMEGSADDAVGVPL